MIEAYSFLAMFTVQIFVASVLYPTWLIKYVRGWARNFGSERFAQLYPGVDYDKWAEQFVTAYRAATVVIAVLGFSLLGWFYNLVQHPDWVGEVTQPTVMYFILQMSPLAVLGLYAVVRYHKLLTQPSRDLKRKAILQRRGLFDFVPPFAVLIAVLSYFLFVVYAIFLDLRIYQNTTLSKYCYGAITIVTLIYAMDALIIYRFLYGRKNPLITHDGRAHTIGVRVKGGVYGSIAIAWFMSLMGTLGQPDLQEWKPFALSCFFVVTALLALIDVTAPSHTPIAHGLRSSAGQ